MRKQLLREAALTLSNAVMICMASEQSDKNSKLLQKETNVHYVKTGGDKSNKHKQRDWHGSKTPTEHKNSDACYMITLMMKWLSLWFCNQKYFVIYSCWRY